MQLSFLYNAQRDLRLPSRLSFRQVSKKQITAPICEETTKTVSAKTVIFHLTFVLHRKRHTQRSFIRSFRVCLNGGQRWIRTCGGSQRSLINKGLQRFFPHSSPNGLHLAKKFSFQFQNTFWWNFSYPLILPILI